MKTPQLSQSFASIALALSSLISSHAFAAAECPMLSQADVIKAFDDPDIRLNNADASGMCNWSLSNSDLLLASVMKRPNAVEAKAIYDSYLATSFAQLKTNSSTPAVGQRAYYGTTAKGAERGQAGFISLQGDTLFVLQYMSSDKLDEDVSAPMLALGRIGSAKKDNAAQSFGKCEWFTPDELAKLLGKGKLTVQRMAENHCIASVIPSGAALTAATSNYGNENALGNMKKFAEKSCTVVALPNLGNNAHAQFACGAPGNTAMAINFVKSGKHIMLTYTPPGRAANKDDINALEGILQRAYERL